jgi:N-alpha-acetyltransferase 35, NatC auxiliary subunit
MSQPGSSNQPEVCSRKLQYWILDFESNSSNSEISSGRLITVQDFRLFDSIGAIEIMDPKMDSGYIPPEEHSEQLDMTNVLAVSQAVWIMEEITSLQLHWFRGYSLSQTLLTSYHIDNLLACDQNRIDYVLFRPPNSKHDEKQAAEASYNSNITQRIFRLFCIAALKIVGLAMAEIDSSFAPIYDEEDISMQTYGLSMFSNVPVEVLSKDISTSLAEFVGAKFRVVGLREQDVKWLMDRFMLLVRHQVALLDALKFEHSAAERAIAWDLVRKIVGALNYDGKKYILKPTPSAFNHRLQRKYASTQPLKPAVQTNFEETRNLWAYFAPLSLAALEIASSYAVPEWVNRTRVSHATCYSLS